MIAGGTIGADPPPLPFQILCAPVWMFGQLTRKSYMAAMASRSARMPHWQATATMTSKDGAATWAPHPRAAPRPGFRSRRFGRRNGGADSARQGFDLNGTLQSPMQIAMRVTNCAQRNVRARSSKIGRPEHLRQSRAS